MLATERRRRILEHVRAHGDVSLRELAQAVLASEITVRRDLRALEEQGLLDRRRGGAATVRPSAVAIPNHEDAEEQGAEKAAIARLAASLVAAGDAIAIAAGTTTQHLATALLGVRDLTVVTNSLLVGEVLSRSDATVVITGGALRPTYGLVGRGAEETFADLRVRRAFLSGDGVTSTWGLSTTSSDQAGVDRMIAESAQEVLVLADHTKLGQDATFQTVAPDRITHLVTDDGADPTVVERLAAAGIRVHLARLDDPAPPSAGVRG